jgi:Flp pilus assembly protein TadB
MELGDSSQDSGVTSERNRYCGRCGLSLQPNLSYCPRCGFALTSANAYQPGSPSQPSDWREQRRQWRAQRRAERYSRSGPHFGAIIIASILLVAGLAIFLPSLPWQFFWGTLLILAGVWIVYLWTTRSARYSPKQNQQSQ